jgi:DNA-binding NarL/FixJ family response regulator
VIDGQPLVRLGVRDLLSDEYEIEEAPTCEEAIEHVHGIGGIDVAIVDMARYSNGSGLSLCPREAIRALRRSEPTLAIVAHGSRAERHLATAAIQAGATTYISRGCDGDSLRAAVRAALDAKPFEDPAMPPKGTRGKLTRRQREILQMLANGESSTAAAKKLGLGEETIKTHTKNILVRLEARNRTEAVALALRDSLIE